MSVNSHVYTAPIPKMPPGLVELMEGLAKDVLMCNPTDVYAFCAEHMKKLIVIRDGSIHKRAMTVEQKIAIANKKIQERAAWRRQEYDKKIQALKEAVTANSEINKMKPSHQNISDMGQYVKGKTVNILEEQLHDGVEHEIAVNLNEETGIDTNISLVEIKPAASISVPISGHQDGNETTTLDNYSRVNAVEKLQSHEAVQEIQKIDEIKEKYLAKVREEEKSVEEVENNKATDSIANYNQDKFSESFAKSDNNHENLKNTVSLECDGLMNDKEYEQDMREKKSTPKNDNLNNYEETVISTTVDEQNYFFSKNQLDFEETDTLTICSDNEKAFNYDIINIYSTNDKQEDSISMNISKNYLTLTTDFQETDYKTTDFPIIRNENHKDVQKKVKALSTTSDQLIKDNELKVKNSELQNHVNNTSMDLETAAITIQKVFRSFLFKNKTLSTEDCINLENNVMIEDMTKSNSDIASTNVSKDRRTLGLNKIDSVLQTVNEEKSLSLSTDDSSTLSSAATIIQAHVRGFLVRNKFNVNKYSSTTSGVDSDGMSFTSVEGENDDRKNKTILNIHIVPENSNFMSRDESVLTSTDLSLDGSPPGSTNLHPLGYDRSERRKQLKREDAIQSISPPSNNSGKLSEDIDSVKEVLVNSDHFKQETLRKVDAVLLTTYDIINDDNIPTMVDNFDTALEVKSLGPIESPVTYLTERPHSLPEMTSDEMDVITPFTPVEEKLPSSSKNDTNLIHSGEFHDVVLPTKVCRSDTSVVRGE